jgi:hypothetical protein
MLRTKCRLIWPSDFRWEDILEITNQKQELPVAAIFANVLAQNVKTL